VAVLLVGLSVVGSPRQIAPVALPVDLVALLVTVGLSQWPDVVLGGDPWPSPNRDHLPWLHCWRPERGRLTWCARSWPKRVPRRGARWWPPPNYYRLPVAALLVTVGLSVAGAPPV
jgi:hypothetical protein